MSKNIALPHVLLGTVFIFAYRAISPLLGTTVCCKFVVSCSEYALQQLNREPFLKAMLNIAKRIGSCW